MTDLQRAIADMRDGLTPTPEQIDALAAAVDRAETWDEIARNGLIWKRDCEQRGERIDVLRRACARYRAEAHDDRLLQAENEQLHAQVYDLEARAEAAESTLDLFRRERQHRRTT